MKELTLLQMKDQTAASKQARFVDREVRSFVSPLGAVAMLGHPDGRLYPWLGSAKQPRNNQGVLLLPELENAPAAYRFAQLEAGVALARALVRGLVLPAWTTIIDPAPLKSLVRLHSAEELKGVCAQGSHNVAVVHVEPSWDSPWFDDAPSFGESSPCCFSHSEMASAHDERLDLDAPMRGTDEVRRFLGHLDSYAVLSLVSAAAHRLVAPSSILNPYERQAHLMPAFRPCKRLQPRLRAFLSQAMRPYVAVRAPVTPSHQVAHEVVRKLQGTATPAVAWLYAGGGTRGTGTVAATAEQALVEALHGVKGVQLGLETLAATPADGLDAPGSEMLRLWACALADHFVGSCRSLDSEWIRRLRVDSGKLVDHRFLPASAVAPPPASRPAARAEAAVPPAPLSQSEPTLPPPGRRISVGMTGRMRERGSWRPRPRSTAAARLHATSHAAADESVTPPPPPSPPSPWEPAAGLHGQALFDDFIEKTLPAVRRFRLRPALPGTTGKVAFIVEPRKHPALEHVVRNVSRFLGGDWQMQIFHGTANAAYVRGLFSPEELGRIQLISLQVDNLGRDAYSELLCSHWFWTRVAAETALLFQTDALLCRRGIDTFTVWDYIGAPWDTREAWCADHEWLHAAGNGGLTIRSRSAALLLLDTVDYGCGAPEDLYFVEGLPRIGRTLAPRDEARKFSVESPLPEDEDRAPEETVGMHAAYKFLPRERTISLLRGIAVAYL